MPKHSDKLFSALCSSIISQILTLHTNPLRNLFTLSVISAVITVATNFNTIFSDGIFAYNNLLSATITTTLAVSFTLLTVTAKLIVKFMTTAGVDCSGYSDIRKYDITGLTGGMVTYQGDQRFNLRSPIFNTDCFIFANSRPLATATGIINSEAYGFSFGPWKSSAHNKIERNIKHSQANQHCLMLVESPKLSQEVVDFPYIGFTHVIPVSKDVWDRYNEGSIQDNDFSEDDIFTLDKNPDESPYGIIIFSVGARPLSIQKKYHGDICDQHRPTLPLMAKATAFHVRVVAEKFFKKDKEIPILAQSANAYCYKFYTKYKLDSGKNSGDGCRIFTAKVKLIT